MLIFAKKCQSQVSFSTIKNCFPLMESAAAKKLSYSSHKFMNIQDKNLAYLLGAMMIALDFSLHLSVT